MPSDIVDWIMQQPLILAFISGFFAACLLWALLLMFKTSRYRRNFEQLNKQYAHTQTAYALLENQLKQEQRFFDEKLKLLESAKQDMLGQFKELSHLSLKENAQDFSQIQQKQMLSLLTPLSEKINYFQKQVTDIYDKEMRERVSLKTHIDHINQTSQNLGEEAQKLSQALKAQSKAQGLWGEVVLEGILENTGLIKDIHYKTQYACQNSDGNRVILDVLLNLPARGNQQGRQIIIDAKVSLRPWMAYQEAHSAEEKSKTYKELEKAMLNHIAELSQKSYERLPAIETLDCVLMFVPQEAALALINEHNPDFFAKALKKNIMPVSPSSLMLSLRIINHLWQLNQQDKFARQILLEAQSLHKKFATFAEHLLKVKNALNTADKAYDAAISSLDGRGGIYSRIRNLENMGAASEKELDEKLIQQIEKPV